MKFMTYFLFILLILVLNDSAIAYSSFDTVVPKNINAKFLSNPMFIQIITILFQGLAIWRWFEYFSNISSKTILKGLFLPIVITFLSFNWQALLNNTYVFQLPSFLT